MIIYRVIHEYTVDGGFGDAVPEEETVVTFSTKEKAEEFVKKYSKPHVYDEPYDELWCGTLSICEETIDEEPEEDTMWWLKKDG